MLQLGAPLLLFPVFTQAKGALPARLRTVPGALEFADNLPRKLPGCQAEEDTLVLGDCRHPGRSWTDTAHPILGTHRGKLLVSKLKEVTGKAVILDSIQRNRKEPAETLPAKVIAELEFTPLRKGRSKGNQWNRDKGLCRSRSQKLKELVGEVS